MSQSKTSKLIAICFVIGFLFIVLSLVFTDRSTSNLDFYPPEHPQAEELARYTGMTPDAIRAYAPIIGGEQAVTDWHSALYMYECRAALHCARSLGIQSNGVRIQIAAYFFHLGIFLTYISILSYYAVRKHCQLFLLMVPLCLSFAFMFEWMPLGLDFFFFIHFTIMSCTLALIPRLKTKHMKILAWIIVAITLFHAVNFRKNAILFVPVVAYLFVYTKNKMNGNIYILLCKWITLVVVFSLISVKLVPWLLPVETAHPLEPMLSSDLRVAAVLRGEQEEFREDMRQRGTPEHLLNHQYKDSLIAYWSRELSMEEGSPTGWETYISCLKEHPGSMLMSRFIQTVEFYCGGTIAGPGQRIIEHIYPALKTNPQAWQFLMRLPRNMIFGRIIVLLFGMVLACYIVFRRLKHRRWEQPYDRPTMVLCAAALIYAGSFVIVPPTADPRYLAPSLFIIWNACWIWLAFSICGIEKRKVLADVHCLCEEK